MSIRILVTLGLLILGVAGCGTTTIHDNTVKNESASNSTIATGKPINSLANNVVSSQPASNATHIDGSVISIKHLTNTYGKSDIYDMYYFSDGVKVEAYVEFPLHPGSYPLFVGCHGGAPIPANMSHVGSPYAATMDQFSTHRGKAIYVYPEYQGYLNSDGTVQDVFHDATDVVNVVKAVKSLKRYDVKGIYMLGGSTGGGVALMAASQMKDVKAVVANSPFIGPELFVKWYEKLGQPDNPLWKSWYQISLQVYGRDISSSAYTSHSVISHIGTIHSPVLLLQGTADKHVMWQPVQELADTMKKQGMTVKLMLFKGAHHGLLSPPLVYNQSTDATQAWFTKYGFPEHYLTNTFF